MAAAGVAATGATNEVIENTSRIYVVRGDVGSAGGTSNTLDVSIASLGSSNAAGGITTGDVSWTDDNNASPTLTWVDQPGASYVQPSSPLTLGANSGTNDATRPTISTIVFGGTTSTNNTLNNGATILITFSERMDANDILSTLIPGGDSVALNGGVGDVSMAATGIITIASIVAIDVDDDDGASVTTYVPTAVLDAAGTGLTITLAGLATGDGTIGSAEELGGDDETAVETILSDVNGNLLDNSNPTTSGGI
ncbi:MAG TPA: hypothetical protein ENI04_00035 [Candidatus Wildermuthbacteria bacterium]|nr:hypothetical protein [Candidatus Wildermuthbacteria bacterium]